MSETIDPDGRRVVLPVSRWEHILLDHPQLDVAPEVLVEVVAAPDERIPGRRRSEEWFYRRGAGPSSWVKVVVHYERDRGVVITAFPRGSFP